MGMLAQAQNQNNARPRSIYEQALKRNPGNIDALMRIAFIDMSAEQSPRRPSSGWRPR